MLRSMHDLQDYAIHATDGAIGHVKDFYFDDESWVIRYLIVETGAWLSSRKVLISPIAIGKANWRDKLLPVAITKEQMRNSPDINTDKPVSRQQEIEYLGYYGYPYYWGGSGLWGGWGYPGLMMPATIGTPSYAGSTAPSNAVPPETAKLFEQAKAKRHENDDLNLRSCEEVIGYHIDATDGDIGHIKGLLVDEETWAIRYLIVNTSHWWLGHEVLIASEWLQNVSWAEKTVSVNLTRQAVKDAPPYDSDSQLNRQEEMDIHEHYRRSGYWAAVAEREGEKSER